MNPTRQKPPNQWKAGQSDNPNGKKAGHFSIPEPMRMQMLPGDIYLCRVCNVSYLGRSRAHDTSYSDVPSHPARLRLGCRSSTDVGCQGMTTKHCSGCDFSKNVITYLCPHLCEKIPFKDATLAAQNGREKHHLSRARAPPVWNPAAKLLVTLVKANHHKRLERTMKNLPFYEIKNPFLKKPFDRLVEYLNSIDRTLNEDAQFGVTSHQLEFQRQQVVVAFHQQMKVEGERIKAEDAEFTYWYTETTDPYGVMGSRLPKSCSCIGREYFVRSRKRGVWVCEHDVPQATRSRLKIREASKDDDDIGF